MPDTELKKIIPSLLRHYQDAWATWDPPSGSKVTKTVDGMRKVFSYKGAPRYRATNMEGSDTIRVWYNPTIKPFGEEPHTKNGWVVISEFDNVWMDRPGWERIEALMPAAIHSHLAKHPLAQELCVHR